MRSLMGVGTPHLRPHSHTTPLIASISQGLPFLRSCSMEGSMARCFFIAIGTSSSAMARLKPFL